MNRALKKTSYFGTCDILMMVLVTYMISGDTSSYALYISMGLFFIWIISILWEAPIISRRIVIQRTWLYFALYLIYIFFITLPNSTLIYTAKQVGAGLLLFSPILIYQQFSKRSRNVQIKLLEYSLLIYLVFCVISLFAYNRLGINARSLASNREIYGDIAIGGGYSLAYSVAVLSVGLLEIRMRKKVAHDLLWIVSYPVFIIMGFVIYQTKSTVTFISWITGVSLSLILQSRSKKNNSLRWLVSATTVVGIALIVINMSAIGRTLMDYTAESSNRMIERLNSLAAWMTQETEYSNYDYFVYRLKLPLMSLRTFLNYPLFGVGFYHGNGFTSSRVYGISQHGEWADALGNYGLIGGIPFLMIYYYSMASIMKRSKQYLSVAWCVVALLIGSFNPIRSFNIHFVMFFLVPALIDLAPVDEVAEQ